MTLLAVPAEEVLIVEPEVRAVVLVVRSGVRVVSTVVWVVVLVVGRVGVGGVLTEVVVVVDDGAVVVTVSVVGVASVPPSPPPSDDVVDSRDGAWPRTTAISATYGVDGSYFLTADMSRDNMCYGVLDAVCNCDGAASYTQLNRRIVAAHTDVGPQTWPRIERASTASPRSRRGHSDTLASNRRGRTVTDGGRVHEGKTPTFDLDFDRLVDHARFVATEPTSTDTWGRSGNQPGYDVAAGERILLVVDTTYDQDVVDAFTRVFHDLDAKVDVVVNDLTTFGEDEIHPWYDEIPGLTRPEDLCDDRFAELSGLLTARERFLQRGVPPIVGGDDLLWWEDVATNYDLLIYGIGGPTPYDTPDRPYRYERLPWRKREGLASESPMFPRPLWRLIDEKTAAAIERAETVHLTDPEGTDLTWTNYTTGIYPRDRPCHIFGHPLLPTAETDTAGVIQGTTNHANAFPTVEVHLERGKVTDVAGGGEYGELWREALDVMGDFDGAYGDLWHETYDDWKQGIGADADAEPFPGSPGFFWLWEVAIGTNPKIARPVGRDVTTFTFPLIERLRAGVVHCGMGTPIALPQFEQKARDRGLPWGHVHVHLLSPTLEFTTAAGETETLIDDGYLTVLDDPDVRRLAAEYGDPNRVLAVDWEPTMPGISADGEYEDYGADPKAWLRDHNAEPR